jgi:hypothetical protein
MHEHHIDFNWFIFGLMILAFVVLEGGPFSAFVFFSWVVVGLVRLNYLRHA